MPFLVIYSTPNRLRFKLYDYYLNDVVYINSFGWQVIAIYRFYKKSFVLNNVYLELRFQDLINDRKKNAKLDKIIDFLEKIKNAL